MIKYYSFVISNLKKSQSYGKGLIKYRKIGALKCGMLIGTQSALSQIETYYLKVLGYFQILTEKIRKLKYNG
jgi:hypothetical protein